MKGCEDVGPWTGRPRAQTMMKSDEVEAMLHLHALGWGLKRIAREFGCSKNTVRRYVEADGWMAYSRQAGGGKLEDQEEWLKERFFRHRGNAEVVRQDLLREQSIDVSLRTVERAVAPLRRLLTAEAKATVRFETPPGRQLQIDFGQLRVPIADERVRVFLFVATLGYSRRCYVAAFRHERQSAWFRGLEGTFRHFGGVTKEVLIDNPRPLVLDHDAKTHAVEFNDRFLAFAVYWGFRPRACAPYRARTKGKDERGVGYVKRNAIAGLHVALYTRVHRDEAIDAVHLDAVTRVEDQRDVRPRALPRELTQRLGQLLPVGVELGRHLEPETPQCRRDVSRVVVRIRQPPDVGVGAVAHHQRHAAIGQDNRRRREHDERQARYDERHHNPHAVQLLHVTRQDPGVGSQRRRAPRLLRPPLFLRTHWLKTHGNQRRSRPARPCTGAPPPRATPVSTSHRLRRNRSSPVTA